MVDIPVEAYWFTAATVLGLLALYAHVSIPHLIKTGWQALLVHVVLALTGGLFGFAAYSDFALVGHRAPGILVFLTGFGAIHVPAALILFFKRKLGAGKA